MQDQPAEWPKDVHRMTWDESGELGIDSEDQLYWKGKPIQIKKRLDLKRGEKILGTIGILSASAGGLAVAFDVWMKYGGK